MAESEKRWTDERHVWNQLDYAHDAIIEASAGTGKTYALESIVLKLIREKGYSPREILLVTFTEKAAAELKNRVREALEKEGCLPPGFDEATICTIHSFCRQLLTEFAFENGVPMQCEIGGDGSAQARCAVLEVLKGPDFEALCPGGLSAALKGVGMDSVDKLHEKVEELVLKGRADGVRRRLHAKETEAAARIAAAHRKLCALPCGLELKHISKRAGFNEKSKTGLEAKATFDWFCGAFALLGDPEAPAFADCLAGLPDSLSANPKVATWDGEDLKRGKSVPNLSNLPGMEDVETPLKELFKAVKDLVKARKSVESGSSKAIRKSKLLLALAERAEPLFEELKKAAALLPFDDMVARAAEVVRKKPETPGDADAQARFFNAIRAHWRVALVDEFQDTDQSQWDIFRILFSQAVNKVEGGKPGFLIVVGDPKQAIYSFRGADVGVYCDAKDKILKAGGQELSLPETFRAKPALVDAFNGFFSGGWFAAGAAGNGIPYEDVWYPEDGNEKFGDRKDENGNRVHGLVDEAEPDPVRLLESMPGRLKDNVPESGGFGNVSVCLPVFMERAAQEMERLHALDPAYKMLDKEGNPKPHRFRYRDMCVLVKANRDAITVRRILARHRIPYGQYKQRGLFDSPEAEGVQALLDYLDNPSDAGNRAALLVSPIFGIKPARLPEFASFPAFDAFVETLRKFADKRKWNELFEAAMSDPCTAIASPDADIHAFNRVRSAVRQIFDLLLATRGRLARTVDDFSATLRAWRRKDDSAGEDGELFGKDSDADRVQIMTMHAAKGLQFPVVFVAAGFTNPTAKESDEDRQQELREEIRRLFYVALTRAEHRIYLPWSDKAWETGIGSDGSPLLARSDGGFLGQAIQTWFNTPEKQAAAFPPETGTSAATSQADSVKPETAAPVGDAVRMSDDDRKKLADLKWSKSFRLQWDSFTSMHRKKKKDGSKENEHPPSEVAPAAGASRLNDEPIEELGTTGTNSLLPGGNICGNVFHETMEALCKNDEDEGQVGFTNARDPDKEEELLGLIREKMRGNSVKDVEEGGDSTAKAFLQMVWHALDIPLDFGGCRFRLREIRHRDRLAETAFVCSETMALDRVFPYNREGAFNGAIDLLVRREDENGAKKVFIVDWKTNSLTKYDNPLKRSGRTHVEAAMEDSGYHLQYKLYALAADAWLKGHDETLAGVAYFFVRAFLQGVKDDVFSTPVDDAVIEQFRTEVADNPAIKAEKEYAE